MITVAFFDLSDSEVQEVLEGSSSSKEWQQLLDRFLRRSTAGKPVSATKRVVGAMQRLMTEYPMSSQVWASWPPGDMLGAMLYVAMSGSVTEEVFEDIVLSCLDKEALVAYDPQTGSVWTPIYPRSPSVSDAEPDSC